MSIFGTIMSKIFHHADAAPAGGAQPSAGAAPENAGRPSAPVSSAPPIDHTAPTTPSEQASAQVTQSSPAAAPSPAPASAVDVGAVLDGLAAKNAQKLDWKHSIVDMMKLLDMDSSLAARKSLAEELHYTGDTGDSATMNVWLHKQVMEKLAANGGKLPADLAA